MYLIKKFMLAVFMHAVFILSVLVASILLLSTSSVGAQDDQQYSTKSATINYEKTNPGNALFILKRLKEKTVLLILTPFPAKKTKTYENIINKRLAELKKVVDEKNIAHIEKSSQRYSANVGEYINHTLTKDSSSKEDAKELLTEHRATVESFLTNFDGRTAEWRFVKHDLDYLDLNLEKLKE